MHRVSAGRALRGSPRRSCLACAVVLILLAGCAGAPESERLERPRYRAEGSGTSLAGAMASAKVDAIEQAVVDLIGRDAAERHRHTLEEELYSTRTPNAFLYIDTMETLRKENRGTVQEPEMVYEMSIAANRQAIRRVLQAEGIMEGNGTGTAGGSAASGRARELVEEENRRVETPANPDASGTGAGSGEAGAAGNGAGGSGAAAGNGAGTGARPASAIAVAPESDELTEDERRFVRTYIDAMTYMVYHDAGSASDGNRDGRGNGDTAGDPARAAAPDPFVLGSAVTQANSYLASQGQRVVQPGRVEELREERMMVLEQESGSAAGIIQWVAERLNADVYIELDARTNSSRDGDRYYATAHVTLRMFETSTGQLLGAVNRRSQRTFSRNSAEDAVLNAVQSATHQAMPEVFDQARTQMASYLSEGVPYELVMQNTPDARALSRFRRRLSDEVERVETVSQAAKQTVFRVRLYGSLNDLEDALYAVADTVPGFDQLYLVMKRGKQITVNTGM